MPMYELNKSSSNKPMTKSKVNNAINDWEKAWHILRSKSSRKWLIDRNETFKLDNERMKPRSEFMEIVFNTESLIDIGQIAILNLPFEGILCFQC
jgi:hypothetical protein